MPRLPTNVYPVIHPNIRVWQHAGSHGGNISGNANIRTTQLTQSYDVRDTDLGDFIRDTLGYSFKRTGIDPGLGNRYLSRKLPIQHPELLHLYASGIPTIQALAPTGRRNQLASWKLMRVFVTFESPPFDLLTDQQIRDASAVPTIEEEWRRYVYVDIEPSVEFIQRRLGSFQYPDVAAAGGARGAPIPDSGGNTQIINKNRLKFTWVQVPDDGLFSRAGFSRGGRAWKIERRLGLVNLDVWHDYEPGRLLFEGWKPIPHSMPQFRPVPSLFPIIRAWDVEMYFSFFDPFPLDPGFIPQNMGGHNAVPHPTNGSWFRVHMTGAPDINTRWRYRANEFASIWQMIADGEVAVP